MAHTVGRGTWCKLWRVFLGRRVAFCPLNVSQAVRQERRPPRHAPCTRSWCQGGLPRQRLLALEELPGVVPLPHESCHATVAAIRRPGPADTVGSRWRSVEDLWKSTKIKLLRAWGWLGCSPRVLLFQSQPAPLHVELLGDCTGTQAAQESRPRAKGEGERDPSPGVGSEEAFQSLWICAKQVLNS